MRVFAIFSLWILLSFAIYAQAPQGLNYQAVARNMDGSTVSGQSVSVRFSIFDGSTSGATVYQEKHQTNTNNFGLFTLVIGRGSVVSGSFPGINWGAGSKFLKVEIAVGGGGYQLQGTTQLLSVPYALYAEKSGNGGTPETIGPQGPAGAQGLIGPAGATGATGPQGQAGATGPQGPVGLTGAVAPQGVAGPVGATGPQGAPGVTGPAGPIGLTGPAGSQGPGGPQGANGKTILNGASNPVSTIGVNDDFFLNTTTSQLFGPKTVAGWGIGISLVGPAGGPPGLKSLINLEDFSATATCPTGGVTVKSGIDQNSNSILDPNEVQNTKQICLTQSSDKVIIMPFFSYDDLSYFGSATTPTTPFGAIIKFSKMNYIGVDSIILVANPFVFDAGNTAILELYNITDNIPITNSTITTTNKVIGNIFNQSPNVFNSLPIKEITIGLSIRSSTGDQIAGVRKAFLVMYRK